MASSRGFLLLTGHLGVVREAMIDALRSTYLRWERWKIWTTALDFKQNAFVVMNSNICYFSIQGVFYCLHTTQFPNWVGYRVILGANKGRAYFVDRLAFWQNPDLLCSDEWLRTRRWCELISVCAFRLVLHGIKQFDSIFIKMFSPKDT